jgi:hypothetical protein
MPVPRKVFLAHGMDGDPTVPEQPEEGDAGVAGEGEGDEGSHDDAKAPAIEHDDDSDESYGEHLGAVRRTQ